MRERAERERESDERATRPAAPAPVNLIARLQQTAGNRAVTAMLAREPLEYVTEPHEGGDARGLLEALGPQEAPAPEAEVADGAQPAAAADPVGDWTGRFTEPAEVADLVLLLASGRAGNVTGADFVIDGGLIPTH